MKNIFFIHWNENELKDMIAPLQKAGFSVNYHFDTNSVADLKDILPDALIICLDRLPSHGKAYAEWLWEAKKRQHIPIIFCGGKPEKLESVKAGFPKARFCSNDQLVDAVSALRIFT